MFVMGEFVRVMSPAAARVPAGSLGSVGAIGMIEDGQYGVRFPDEPGLIFFREDELEPFRPTVVREMYLSKFVAGLLFHGFGLTERGGRIYLEDGGGSVRFCIYDGVRFDEQMIGIHNAPSLDEGTDSWFSVRSVAYEVETHTVIIRG